MDEECGVEHCDLELEMENLNFLNEDNEQPPIPVSGNTKTDKGRATANKASTSKPTNATNPTNSKKTLGSLR